MLSVMVAGFCNHYRSFFIFQRMRNYITRYFLTSNTTFVLRFETLQTISQYYNENRHSHCLQKCSSTKKCNALNNDVRIFYYQYKIKQQTAYQKSRYSIDIDYSEKSLEPYRAYLYFNKTKRHAPLTYVSNCLIFVLNTLIAIFISYK